jgi:hypothetical protein
VDGYPEVTPEGSVQKVSGRVKAVMPNAIRQAYNCSTHNRAALVKAVKAACFHCNRVFATSEITEWTDLGETALCPACGIDAVLPEMPSFPITPEFLNAMNRHWFAT